LRGAFTALSAPAFPPEGFSITARVGRLDFTADLAVASFMLLPDGAARRATLGLEGFSRVAAIARSCAGATMRILLPDAAPAAAIVETLSFCELKLARCSVLPVTRWTKLGVGPDARTMPPDTEKRVTLFALVRMPAFCWTGTRADETVVPTKLLTGTNTYWFCGTTIGLPAYPASVMSKLGGRQAQPM